MLVKALQQGGVAGSLEEPLPLVVKEVGRVAVEAVAEQEVAELEVPRVAPLESWKRISMSPLCILSALVHELVSSRWSSTLTLH